MADKVAWGIIGLGGIAANFARQLPQSRTGQLLAVASRTQEKADNFAKQFPAERRYASYEALLADKDVQAVYIALPNHMHGEWAARTAAAGKAVLCEKPLTSNAFETMMLRQAVRPTGVFFMEAFMYRCHPQTARLAQLIQEKVIGDVRMIQAQFSFNMGPKYENIRLSNEAAGGGIMDVGCYTTSMARLIAGAATGKPFAEPISIQSSGYVGPVSRVDEWAAAILEFPGQIIASILCGTQVAVDGTLRIWGSGGSIIVPSPWFASYGPGDCKIIVQPAGKPAEEIVMHCDRGVYAIEADVVAENIDKPEAPWPAMTWADTLGNMRVLDTWRKQVGVVSDGDSADRPPLPPRLTPGCRLTKSPDSRMTYGTMAGINKPVSRLILGTMGHVMGTLPAACAMLDTFVEEGGTCIDTARFYGEMLLGKWLKSRGVREQLVIIAKGAHTPDCTPDGINRHIPQSLEAMGIDYADMFIMHRDDPKVPVGEFVQCLNDQVRSGRIRAFGGSNWTIERLAQANEYARAHGLIGFAASSPNLALARWNEPMWGGCVSASDPQSLAWYRQSQLPLLAWSSQANGFMSGQIRPEDRNRPALGGIVRTWFNDANFQRLDRARELAQKKGVSVLQIALAWVLCQAFPTYAMIGPQTTDEMHESIGALNLKLTDQELGWLMNG